MLAGGAATHDYREQDLLVTALTVWRHRQNGSKVLRSPRKEEAYFPLHLAAQSAGEERCELAGPEGFSRKGPNSKVPCRPSLFSPPQHLT